MTPKMGWEKGLSFQIFELEDSGLQQQGILPISARKTITMANHRCLVKDSPHRLWVKKADKMESPLALLALHDIESARSITHVKVMCTQCPLKIRLYALNRIALHIFLFHYTCCWVSNNCLWLTFVPLCV